MYSKPQNYGWAGFRRVQESSAYGGSPDYGWGGNDLSGYSNSIPSYSTGQQWSQYQPGENWTALPAPNCKDLFL